MKSQTHRTLASGAAYEGLITPAAGRDRLISKEAGVPDTLKLVARVATEYRGEVGKLADKLRVNTATGAVDVMATCRAFWQFVYGHIQYHLDEPGLEQVRHPARSWADRVRGVDCEDYAVFLSAMLQQLEVPHLLRISAYKGGWQHIYVIVPKDAAQGTKLPKSTFIEDYKKANPDTQHLLRQEYITLDCVTDQFDYEVAPSKTMNLVMPQLLELSGFDDADEIGALSGVYDTQIVLTYPSETGHTIGIGDLGGLFVRDEGDFEEIGGLGAIGGFKPFLALKSSVQKASKLVKGRIKAPLSIIKSGKPFSTKPAKGGLFKKMVGLGGFYRNPAEIPGATDIAAAWLTESKHFVGMDHLGTLYVMDHNDQIERLAGLAGLDPNDPELAGWLKNAFKKVTNVAKAVAKPIAQASTFVAKNASNAVQKGVLDNLNKIPGVKYMADNYGMDILTTVGGAALTAVTGGAAAAPLLALKAAKAGSIAVKVAKVAKLANTAKKAVQVASKGAKVAKVITLAKKAQKVVQVAKSVAKMIPQRAEVPAEALTFTENETPFSLYPDQGYSVQDFAPQPLNLVQRVEAPEEEEAPAPRQRQPQRQQGRGRRRPTVALTPQTARYADEDTVVTASVDPSDYADEENTYATEETDDTVNQDIQGLMPNRALMVQRDTQQIGALGMDNTTVMVAGGAVLAVGIGLLLLSGRKKVIRAATGLSGTPKRRRAAANRGPKRRKGGARTLNL